MKKSKFVNKVVNKLDKRLYKIKVDNTTYGDVVTIDWKYGKNLSIKLTHDRYGKIINIDLNEPYIAYERARSKEYKRCILGGIINGAISDIKSFIRKKEEEIHCSHNCHNHCNGICSCDCDEEEFDNYEDEIDEDEYEFNPFDVTSEDEELDIFEVDEEIREDKKIEFRPYRDDEVTCPRCGSDSYRKNGSKRGIQQYICKSCGRYYNESTKNTYIPD